MSKIMMFILYLTASILIIDHADHKEVTYFLGVVMGWIIHFHHKEVKKNEQDSKENQGTQDHTIQ